MPALFNAGSSPQTPASAAEAKALVTDLLRRAGYDVEDAQEATLGVAAVKAVLEIHGASGGRAENAPKLGRNDPCPCGSGRKFKKCCEGKTPAKPAAADNRLAALRDPALVPRFHDVKALQRDFGVLNDLLTEDADLRKVRFSRQKVAAFLFQTAAERADGREPGPEERDELVSRYLREIEGPKVLGNVRAALLAAARRSGRSTEELRALASALGVFDLDASPVPETGAPNPLYVSLFWVTAQEQLRALGQIGEVVKRFGGVEELGRKLEAGELSAEIRQALEGMDAAALEPLVSATRERLEGFQDRLRKGQFPVGIAMASLLPFFVRAAKLDPKAEATPETLSNLLVAGAAALETEDLALLDAALAGWLATEQAKRDAEAREGAVVLRTHLAEGNLGPFAVDLFLAGARHGRVTLCPGEEPFWQQGNQSADWLERYGDFLRDQGYPALARRTWRLCEEIGPLPETVRAKLG